MRKITTSTRKCFLIKLNDSNKTVQTVTGSSLLINELLANIYIILINFLHSYPISYTSANSVRITFKIQQNIISHNHPCHPIRKQEPFIQPYCFHLLSSSLVNLVGFLFLKLSSSVQFSHSVISDSLRPHKPQHARPPCPSPSLGGYPNSCPLSW